MTLEEAHRLIAATDTAESVRSGAIQGGAVERWRVAPPDEQRRLAEAMWTLLDVGEPWDREVASAFFTSVIAPDDVRRAIVDAYVARGWDAGEPAAKVLVHFVGRLTPAEVQALRGAYFADPARQPHLIEVLLRSDDDGAVWRRFAADLEKTDDVEALLGGFDAILTAPARAPDYYALLAKKGEAVVRRVAARLGPRMAQKLLAGCGLK